MFLTLTSTPKIAPEDQKKSLKDQKSAKEAPNMNIYKTKDKAVLPKPKLIVCIGM